MSNVGRPSSYSEEYKDQAYKLCLLGATDLDLANFFEVAESTINLWKKEHIEFSESIKTAKQMADATVADRLFKRATGYEHDDVDIKQYQGEIIKTPITKHYPPDTTAAIFWLKNRQKDKWRDQSQVDSNVNLGVDVSAEQAEQLIRARAKRSNP